jgi:peroxin-6
VDKKQEAGTGGSQTIAEAMEAFNLGATSPSPVGTPTTNGDSSLVGSIHGRIKGLKQWPGGIVRSTSGQSTVSSKGKGKGSHVGGDSDASLEGDDEEMADGRVEDEDEEDYIVRTDHLANPMEEVE